MASNVTTGNPNGVLLGFRGEVVSRTDVNPATFHQCDGDGVGGQLGTVWHVVPATAPAWSSVLAAGATTGANDPVLTNGRVIRGEDNAGAAGAMAVRGGASTGGPGGAASFAGGDGVLGGGFAALRGGVASAGPGGAATLAGGGGTVRGGDVQLLPNASGANSLHGNTVVGAGAQTTTDTNGFLHLRTMPGAPRPVTAVAPTTYAGRAPIAIDTVRNAFWRRNTTTGLWQADALYGTASTLEVAAPAVISVPLRDDVGTHRYHFQTEIGYGTTAAGRFGSISCGAVVERIGAAAPTLMGSGFLVRADSIGGFGGAGFTITYTLTPSGVDIGVDSTAIIGFTVQWGLRANVQRIA